jgi:biopolymer transport protein TolR
MSRTWQASVLMLMLMLTVVCISSALRAQQPGGAAPLQRGVSVQMAVTNNAVTVPDADAQDALLVAVTADGTTFLRGDRVPMQALASMVRSLLAARTDKTIYLKADARVPYARVVEVIDTVQTSGVELLTLLTVQMTAADPGRSPAAPRGLEMRVGQRR